MERLAEKKLERSFITFLSNDKFVLSLACLANESTCQENVQMDSSDEMIFGPV